MLNLSTALLEHLKKGGPYCHFITLNLAPSALYFNDGSFDIVYDGKTFLGNGLLRKFDNVKIRSEITVNKNNIEFTAVAPDMVAVLLSNNQINRIISISRAYLNDDGTVLATLPLMQLQVNGEPSIKATKNSASIKLPTASIWADFEKIAGRRSTLASQQKYFPNCTGHFAAAEAGKEYKWGSK